jgi:hypothetical protein
MEVGDQDPGLVAALATDDLGAGQNVRPAQLGTLGQPAVNPTGFQSGISGGSQVRSEKFWRCNRGSVGDVSKVTKRLADEPDEPTFVSCLRLDVVYSAIEGIHFSPLWVDGSRSSAGRCFLWG